MFNINQLLEKVRSLRNSDIGLRLSVQAAVKKNIGIEAPVETIQIKSSRITIKNISSAARSELFLKKEKILADINSALGGVKTLKDIS